MQEFLASDYPVIALLVGLGMLLVAYLVYRDNKKREDRKLSYALWKDLAHYHNTTVQLLYLAALARQSLKRDHFEEFVDLRNEWTDSCGIHCGLFSIEGDRTVTKIARELRRAHIILYLLHEKNNFSAVVAHRPDFYDLIAMRNQVAADPHIFSR